MSREEGAVMEESCRFLERAARLDEWIPLPRLEYEQLCDLLERPAQPWGNPAMDQPIEIGYRKQDYRHSLDNWSVTVDGNLQARYPARNVLTLARDQRTVKVEALRAVSYTHLLAAHIPLILHGPEPRRRRRA